ncbi:MAG TPA: hypothetical protein PLV33_04540 [Opitutaceae bacterium]|nr:hypothetical protein [Opitutaceae bacterium]HOR24854.1 hypothetical protein [Opitutaceae bacterium]HPK49182.1 hypothetical protein [Opitutaceae bacterium]
MNLDDKITAFLATADAKAARSKLEPYAELIRQLRQRRWTYDQIAQALHDNFGLCAHRTTIHAFVKARAGKGKGAIAMPSPDLSGSRVGTSASVKRPRFNLDP